MEVSLKPIAYPLRSVLIGLSVFMGSLSAHAQDASVQSERYNKCIELSETNPSRSFDDAVAWRDLGGGDAAEHCAAVSLVALELYKAGAERLEALAQTSTDSVYRRAGLLSQAAQAWLLDGKLERAYANLTTAIQLAPDVASLFIDRGAIHAEMGLYEEAVTDLDMAVTLDPGAVYAYLFRASANRYLENYDLALRDLGAVLHFSPTHLDALLERGIVRRLEGDDDAARKDWMWVLTLGPDSEAATMGRRNLELMDVKTD